MTTVLPDSQATVLQPNSSTTVPSRTSSSFSSSTTSVTYLTDTSTSETTIVGSVTSSPTSSATVSFSSSITLPTNLTSSLTTIVCQDFAYGDSCSYGENNTVPIIDTAPVRKVNITFKFNITFIQAFLNLTSPESQIFINKLEAQLRSLCRQADPQAYKTVKVIKLSEGSVVAKSLAEYQYQNNETQIEFINTHLSVVLKNILQNNLNKISLAFGNQSVELNDLSFEAPAITNITELKPFINCTQFANYTEEITNGQWQCVGPCKINPDYCNGHGECLNDIYTGPVCRCYETSLEQFYGPQCDLFRRGPGFYGALFGSLAVALLLFIIIVIAVIFKRRHTYTWKRSNSQRRRLSFLEGDFFDFTDTRISNLGLAGTYRSENI
ncbi:mucin-3B [Haplochromis burtoni]|uniref:mucin-3B n=1 Tax=Haplochromis burtoni TaxID=8153 RepID=UPI0003BDBD6D|nr:mucin-3B [Haplochromis burtoni]